MTVHVKLTKKQKFIARIGGSDCLARSEPPICDESFKKPVHLCKNKYLSHKKNFSLVIIGLSQGISISASRLLHRA